MAIASQTGFAPCSNNEKEADMKSFALVAALALTSMNAWAGVSTVPEPGALPLFALGAVGGLAIWLRSRNKK